MSSGLSLIFNPVWEDGPLDEDIHTLSIESTAFSLTDAMSKMFRQSDECSLSVEDSPDRELRKLLGVKKNQQNNVCRILDRHSVLSSCDLCDKFHTNAVKSLTSTDFNLICKSIHPYRPLGWNVQEPLQIDTEVLRNICITCSRRIFLHRFPHRILGIMMDRRLPKIDNETSDLSSIFLVKLSENLHTNSFSWTV
ncbi:TPA_asm: protein 4 [Ribes virus 1]|uniref:Protein 4 n=1 Tax=Ribes virus 1 TaxID=2977985 RepID=A0A9N6YJJ0_9RHAB|nr:TPA_asm: protein 4 [Ribes virus 1]